MGLSYRSLIILFGILIATGPLSVDMYLPSFPAIAKAMHTQMPAVQSSLAVFFLGLALGQLVYGALADRYGRKRPLLAGFALFVIASAGCALSREIETLIFWRFLQAFGCCAGIVLARASVRDLFETRDVARAFSMLMLVMGVAPIVGPLLGGYIGAWLGWAAIFWCLTAYGAINCVLIVLRYPETLPLEKRQARFSVTQSLRVYKLLLTDRHFLRYALAGSLAQSGMFTYITASPYVLIEYYGLPSTWYGWIFGLNAFGLIAASQINHRLLKTQMLDSILSRALYALMGIGAVLVLCALTDLWLPIFMAFLFVYIALLGMVFPNSSAAALEFQAARAGSAAALLGSLQFGAAALVAGAISQLHAASAVPMAGAMALAAVAANMVYRGMSRMREPHSQVAQATVLQEMD